MSVVSDAAKRILARLATEEAVQSAPIVDAFSTFQKIADELEIVRQRLCPYPNNGSTCDCKYGLGYGVSLRTSDKTGCPELRDMITVYRGAARGFPIT